MKHIFPLFLLLSSCYQVDTKNDLAVDSDGDGVTEFDGDCDDGDAQSTVVADDGDCDGVPTAEDCDDGDAATVNDMDCDGVLTADDCDDSDADSTTVSTDGDCDGVLTVDDCDDGDSDSTLVAADGDCDGVLTVDDCDDGDSGSTVVSTDGDCDGVLTGDDCDDGDNGLGDIGLDGDCDGVLTVDDCDDGDSGSTVVATDGDCDGALSGDDCDDAVATSYPGADEVCNGVDDNCDGAVDEDTAVDALTWYADTDADTFGDAAATHASCVVPPGYVADDTDCNDGDANINPGADELCSTAGVDDDCDTEIDEDSAADPLTFYADGDGDSYGDPLNTSLSCAASTGGTVVSGTSAPAAAIDASNTLITDTATLAGCGSIASLTVDMDITHTWQGDLEIDLVSPTGTTVRLWDATGGSAQDIFGNFSDAATDLTPAEALSGFAGEDGAGDWVLSVYDNYASLDHGVLNSWGVNLTCGGTVADATDCDDTDADVNTAATEYCNGIDDNCDTVTDEDTAADVSVWYEDSDADGYGDPAQSPVTACYASGFYTADNDTDCNDSSATSTVVATDGDCDGVLTGDDCDDGDSGSTVVATDGDCDGVLTGDDCDDGDSGYGDILLDGDCDGVLSGDDCDDGDSGYGDILLDGDCDGVLTGDDCDDGDATVGACLDPGAWTSVSAGYYHSNGLRGDGRGWGWGSNASGESTVPPGTYLGIDSGWGHTCVINTDDSISCWGDISGTPSTGSFESSAGGNQYNCGLKTDGSIQCWGNGTAGPSSGTFTQLDVGQSAGCAIDTSNGMQCWGMSGITGTFNSVAVSPYDACAITTTGAVECWGSDGDGIVSLAPTSGTFTKIAVGIYHACAIDTNGSIECWGCAGGSVANANGQCTPPAGSFVDIAAGNAHVCAISTAGEMQCWGRDASGESSPPVIDPLDTDNDGDGYTENEGDCDDSDPNVVFCLSCPSGQFGYWSFNETSGSVAADSFGNNDATAQGAVPFANGIHGYARDLGGQSNAQYLDFPQAVGDATMGAQTISFWIRTNSGTAQHGRHLYTTSSSQSSPGQYIREYGHYIDWNVTNGSSYCINAASTSSASLTANTWHHIALTWDGQSGGTYSIYVDGQLDVSGTASCSQSGSAAGPPALGSLENGTCGGSGVQCTDGQIDEFGVWDLALSAAEVQDIYQGGCEPTPPALDPLDTDDDGDGYTENEGDCDDTDPNVTCISCGNSTLVSGEVCLSTATIFSGSTRYLSADLTTNWTCTSTGNHAIDEAAAFCLDNGFSSGRVVDTSGSYDYVYSYCTNGSNGGIYSGHGSANIVVQREVACQ